jgi:hypothetical protein
MRIETNASSACGSAAGASVNVAAAVAVSPNAETFCV